MAPLQPIHQIIPKPQKVTLTGGFFTLSEETKIIATKETSPIARYLRTILIRSTGYPLNVGEREVSEPFTKFITLILDNKDISLGSEGYALNITPNSVRIIAGMPSGIFYGIQTLRQLFVKEIESDHAVSKDWRIPCCNIEDSPRFEWRGYMLDEGRYFLGKAFVKELLDVLSLIKINKFHWHLTEDQGWRVEIKKYPRLTSVGSKRKSTPINRTGSNKPDGIPHEGYYTHEDIREIVQYAKERFIDIVPEIEIPGHSQAALAAYPELGCFNTIFEVSSKWGVHKEVCCGGKDNVYTFFEDVLDELIPLFPYEVFHIGGDEVPKARWKKCPHCQQKIKDLGLSSEHELQVYMTNHFANYLASKGKRLMGWQEILGDKLNPNAIAQYWTGNPREIINHINHGRDVVYSHGSHAYIDYTYQKLPLKQVYSIDPIPKGIDPNMEKHILGVEAEMWGEVFSSREMVYWFTFPRILALAERGWSHLSNRSYLNFNLRVKEFCARLTLMGFNFADYRIWDGNGVGKIKQKLGMGLPSFYHNAKREMY